MSFRAPLLVPVEVAGADRRVHRLSRDVAETGLTLERPAPFGIGEPVTVRFALPDVDASPTVSLRAVVELTEDDGEGEQGGRAITFADPSRETRAIIARYVAARWGLPGV